MAVCILKVGTIWREYEWIFSS